MSGSQGDVIQWKRLWQLVSGINFETPTKIVSEQLTSVAPQLLDGLKQFHKNKPESDQKLKDLLKKSGQEKLLTFSQKLQQYLNLDAIQTWEILCHYLINEYKGSSTSLANYISTESAMLKLLNEIWSYYSLERMILLKTVKTILEFHSDGTEHPYAAEYAAALKKIEVKKLLSSYIEQFEDLTSKSLPEKTVHGDLFNSTGKLIAWNERNVREEVTILQIILLAIDYLGNTDVKDVKKLLEIFKSHSFGRQQQYLNGDNSYHGQLLQELMFHEVAVVLKIFDLNENQGEEYVQELVSSLNKTILSLHQFPEHGPLLLTWMLVNFRLKESRVDDEIANKHRQLGSRAVQLKSFEWLLAMISHKTFQDAESKVAVVVRKTIYSHLGVLCDLFDATSVCNHQKIYELTSELLKTPEIAEDFCRQEEGNGLRGLLDVAMESFPVTFTQLSQISSALSQSGAASSKKIQSIIEELPVYTEEYIANRYFLKPSQEQDTFLLVEDYRPFVGIPEYRISKGSEVVVVDKGGRTFCHFRTQINYFTVLHHEIDHLLRQLMHYTEIDTNCVTKITTGLKFLASVLRRTKHPSQINEFMVHPTEMVFDLLTKFRAVQEPPLELMAVCLRVCTALVPLFDQEIVTRVLNLGILPSMKVTGLGFHEYANGHGFEPELVGNYLINFEKNQGKYLFLKEYLDFLVVYKKLNKDNVDLVDLPGLIFLLREVFPNLHTWNFDTDKTRIELNTLILRHFFDILQPSDHPGKKLLRQICIHSLLHLGNGVPLLRLIAVGNDQLQIIMENESNWMSSGDSGVNYIIQLALTVLMQILRYKQEVEGTVEHQLTPIESLIYAQPKQVDTFRIISVVTSYMNNIFNQRLPILACRLLRRFALEFQMSLLACLDMEPDQIRLIFLQRLRDDLESHQLKVAILEFVESCIEKQPGLTEAFFKISYEHEKRFLEQIKATKKKSKQMENEGILDYMQEFLGVVGKSPEKIASPLLSRIMTLFHSLWKNNMQGLVSDLMEKKEFWSSICAPLFTTEIYPQIKAYSQLFNILGVEVFRVAVGAKFDENFRAVIERFLEKSNFQRWLKQIFSLPEETEVLLDSTPEWLCRLQSFKDLIVLIMKCKPIYSKFPEASQKQLADQCLTTLIERTTNLNDSRPLVILAELYLILLRNQQGSYTEDRDEDRKLLESSQKLLKFLADFYKNLLPRAKNSILAICIKIQDMLSSTIVQERSISIGMLQSCVDIVCLELFALECEAKNGKSTEKSQFLSPKDPKKTSAELSLILLKNLVMTIEQHPYKNWNYILNAEKIYHRILSCLSGIIQNYEKRKISVELLELLVVFASGDCSKELLFVDVGDYLWLKLLPPKELLQKINAGTSTWQIQDWWPIYIKGIQLVAKMLETHAHNFKKDAIFFIGIHEEYLLDSLLLVKQCLEPRAIELIKTTLALLCEMCRYEQYWRLEHGQSMANLMRCVQMLMDSSVSLLYRPKILKRLIDGDNRDTGNSELDDLIETRDLAENTDEIVEAMNQLIEIITISSRCLLWFSPPLLTLMCESEFIPSKYFALIEIQFGAPKLNQDNSLSFGTVLSAVSIFTKSLNLQQFNFSERPLNYLPGEEVDADETDTSLQMSDTNLSRLATPTHSQPPTQATTPMAGSPRTHFSKSLSMTSVTSFTAPSGIAPSNELLSHLDRRTCLTALEMTLTLLASQSLLALRSEHLSFREKQLIRRELSTELLQFHDFVRKKVSREMWKRKKHGQMLMKTAPAKDDDTLEQIPEEDLDETLDKTPVPIMKSTDHAKSLRVNLAKKLHQKHVSDGLFDTTVPISPIGKGKPEIPKGTKDQSTPLKSILKPTTSTSQKRHVMFETEQSVMESKDDSNKKMCQDDEVVLMKPDTEPPYTGLSYVKIVEEDYFHFLSNLFVVVAHTE